MTREAVIVQLRLSLKATMAGIVAVGALVACVPALATVYFAMLDVVVDQPAWLLAAVGCEALGMACGWYIEKRLVGVRHVSDVAIPHLAANAVSCVAPMGGAAGAAVHLRLLRRRNVPMVRAVSGLAMSGLLGTLAQLVLVPLVLGSAADGNSALGIGGAVTFGVAATCCWLALCSPRAIGVGVRTVNVVLARLPRRSWSSIRVPDLLERQAELRAIVTERPLAMAAAIVGRAAGDYLALYVALLAVGAHVSPAGVMAVYLAISAASAVPLTPGGIGLIEVAMTAALVAAGVNPVAAATAVAVYRAATCWLPVAAGAAAFLLGDVRRRPAPAPSVPVAPAEVVVAASVEAELAVA